MSSSSSETILDLTSGYCDLSSAFNYCCTAAVVQLMHQHKLLPLTISYEDILLKRTDKFTFSTLGDTIYVCQLKGTEIVKRFSLQEEVVDEILTTLKMDRGLI